jgi:putative oxidoreductase
MNTKVQDTAALVGRILLALIFIISGFGKITGYAGTAGYMASKGLPLVDVLLPLTILIELGGGLLIAIGWKARWAAAVTCLFLIPVTLVFHNPAGLEAAQAQAQMIQLLKNISIMGGMLGVFAFGAGRFSIDASNSGSRVAAPMREMGT